jgi:hypothetical protein
MALIEFKTQFNEFVVICGNPPYGKAKGGRTADEIVKFVNEYIDEKTAEYKTNVKNRCLNFGKWKGMNVKEIIASEKGRDYLMWLLKQAWFTEEKNELIYEDLREAKILKKQDF